MNSAWPNRTRALSAFLFCGLAIIACEMFLVQGLILPVRIHGSSMVPSLLGQHFSIKCDECRFPIRFDTLPNDGVVCPNCGWTRTDVRPNELSEQMADRVLIDKIATRFRAPKRWEIVAFRRPDGQKTVKRLIGLPGEKVRIHQGDIWIDNEPVSKPLAIQQSMLMSVHTDAFRNVTLREPRWRPENKASWVITDNGYESKPANAVEYLTYNHSACLSPPIGRAEKPVFDSYGFNQSLSRELQTVSDIVLRCQVEWLGDSGDGLLTFRFVSNGRIYEFGWQRKGTLTLAIADGQSKQKTSVPTTHKVIGSGLVAIGYVDIGYVDGVAFLALDGKTVVKHRLGNDEFKTESESESKSEKFQARPFSIGVSDKAHVAISELRVSRDIHYFSDRGQQDQWQLGDDQFLLLGDNVPVSEDARHDAEFGVIRKNQILGRIVPPVARQ